MSRLSNSEFQAMNSFPRRLLQKYYEFPRLKRMGVRFNGKDILEIGCGSGYGALLIVRDKPQSYIGIDIMEEQIELAKKRNISCAEFRIEDAAQMQTIADSSKDLIVILGILHHIPEWRSVILQCHRVLRPEGEIYLEEPLGELLYWFDKWWSKWEHPKEGHFLLKELESNLLKADFKILRTGHIFGFGFFRAQKI